MSRVERLDNKDFRIGLLFFWIAAFCLFGMFGCAVVPAISFGAFPFCFAAFLAICQGAYYLALGWSGGGGSQYAEDEDEEENALEEENAPQAQAQAQEKTQSVALDETQLKARTNFYAFIYGVCRQGALGEVAWQKRGMPEATYRKWIKILEADGIVSAGAPGQIRTVRKSFEDALAIIAENAGEKDFWRGIENYYSSNKNERSLLMFLGNP